MKSPKALLLYEEVSTCELLRTVVSGEGCEVEEAPLETQTTAKPVEGYCLVLFDSQRPTPRWLEVLRAWHDGVPGTTVLVVGSRTAEANRIAVLETGVNAYLMKPVIVPELAVRVRAAVRRLRSYDLRMRQLPLETGAIDLEAHVIRAPEGHVRLTPTECGILEYLALHINQTVSGGDLVKILWGDDPQKGVHSLRLLIQRLRQKLEPDPAMPRYLVTEPTFGYRLQAPSEVLTKSAER